MADNQQAAKAIADLHAQWAAAVQRDDAEALGKLVTDDYEVWVPSVPPLRGPAAVVAAMRSALERVAVLPAFDSQELIIAGDWAIQRGIERMTVTPRTGGTSETRSQRAMLVLRCGDDGQWRYARGMTNALGPGER